MKRINVTIQGVEPGVLMNRFSIEEQAASVKNYKKKQNAPGMEEELERACYRREDGELYIPAEWLYQTLLKAAGEYSVPGRGKKSFRDFVKSAVVVTPEEIGLGTKKYSVDCRPVVIRATKGRIVRYRPHLPRWEINFDIMILDEDLIDSETLSTILNRAGQTVGVGDYRPRYGRFIVTKFSEVKVSKQEKKQKILTMSE